MAFERLQKYIARCGVASRRQCEKWIQEGKVEVNGSVVTELGTKVDPDVDSVKVDDRHVRPGRRLYFALFKPKGVVCTARDPSGRPRVIDLVPSESARLFPIGRLDTESEGLILLTNDGELAQRVAHPRYEMSKVYRVEVKGDVTGEQLEKLQHGVWLADGKTRATKVVVDHRSREMSRLFITLREGMNREVRRMLAKVGLPVKRLMRVRIGPVKLGSLKRGRWRPLTREEIDLLKGEPPRVPKPRRGGKVGARARKR